MVQSKRASLNGSRKIRYAVVGLGHIAQTAVLPAFRHAANSELVAIISEDPVKRRVCSRRYRVPLAVDYAGFDALMQGGAVDAVYIALPNDLHRDFCERAAAAGVHILCEKPLATTSKDCVAMAEAAHHASVRLMTAYRLHFDAANLEAIRLLKAGMIGNPRVFNSTFTMQVKEGNIRAQASRGGGPLLDIGVYCINAARSLFRAEPIEVVAMAENNGEKRFRQIDEAVSATLRFPDARLASFVVSFGAADVGRFEVVGTKGSIRLDPAYDYAEGLTAFLERDGHIQKRVFGKHDQFASELVYFSDCILSGKEPEPSADEGLADVRVVEALEQSLRSGRSVRLPTFRRPRHPQPTQRLIRPPNRKPETVHASSPHPD